MSTFVFVFEYRERANVTVTADSFEEAEQLALAKVDAGEMCVMDRDDITLVNTLFALDAPSSS